jgi:hypothetical protein
MPKKPSRPVSAETKRKREKANKAKQRSDSDYRSEERVSFNSQFNLKIN